MSLSNNAEDIHEDIDTAFMWKTQLKLFESYIYLLNTFIISKIFL